MIKLYHNPQCSKSREMKAALTSANIDFEIIEYTKKPPNIDEWTSLFAKINTSILDNLRQKDSLFRDLNLFGADDDLLLEAITANPKIVNRPIIETEDKAVLARPFDEVYKILPELAGKLNQKE